MQTHTITKLLNVVPERCQVKTCRKCVSEERRQRVARRAKFEEMSESVYVCHKQNAKVKTLSNNDTVNEQ